MSGPGSKRIGCLSRLQKALIAALVVLILAALTAGVWFGDKAYKKSSERKLIREAQGYVSQKDWENASICLQRAFQINPKSIEGSRLLANVLDASGSPNALTWRIQVAELEPDNVTNHFLWAKTAIKANDFKSAQEALAGVGPAWQDTAEYHKISGALAWSLGRSAEAEQHYAEALRLEPNNQTNILNLETIRVSSTNQAVALAASAMLEQVVTNLDLGPIALQHLLAAAIGRNDLAKAVAYAKETVAEPISTFTDKITYLELLHLSKSNDYESWLATLKSEAVHSPIAVNDLGEWMAKTETPSVALAWLHGLPMEMQTNLPVPLVITDCQIALKDWAGLQAFTAQQKWGEVEYYRLAIAALAEHSLRDYIAAENDWSKALLLSENKLNRLSRLAGLTGAWGWRTEKTDVLHRITDEFPKEKWAANELMDQLYADGNTSGLEELLTKLHNIDPDDVRIETDLATILLLLRKDDTAALFTDRDFTNLPPLINKLKVPDDAVTTFLRDNLPKTTLEALTNYHASATSPDPMAVTLAQNFNEIMEGQPIYDTGRFAGITLRPQTRKLLARNPQEDELTGLNRRLLEDAYPQILSRGRIAKPDQADVMAAAAYQAQPKDPFCICAQAYALWLQAQSDEALKVLAGLKPEYLKIPSIAAYYGTIEAETGHMDIAKAYLDRAEKAPLLPEEKAMIQRAENDF